MNNNNNFDKNKISCNLCKVKSNEPLSTSKPISNLYIKWLYNIVSYPVEIIGHERVTVGMAFFL